jgi:hypothetical protein
MNGKINNVKELIPGFAALRALDSNHDGHLNNADAEWSKLKIWKDAGLDGAFHRSELFKLSEIGVTDIDLAYFAANKENNGNTISQISHFTWADGSTGEIASVELVSIPSQVELA